MELNQRNQNSKEIIRLTRPIIITLVLFPLLVGFVGGISFSKFTSSSLDSDCNSSQFQYIDSKLICDKPAVSKQYYIQLKDDLLDSIQAKTKQNEVSGVSIYFRDLENGPTLGINEHDSFAPASLLKLPVLLTYLNIAQDKPEILEQKITYKLIEDSYNPFFPPKDPIKEGNVYTVNELLTHMIKYSDNQAYFVLSEYLKQISPDFDLTAETTWDLGIVDPQHPQDNVVTVKSYAYIFPQLYFASFFTKKEMSERVLAMLADTDFKVGLEEGVPSGIKTAHKFGERELDNGLKQLQDCGVVYYPQNPYLVCIMVRGNDMNKLAEAIGSFSKMIYQEFDSRKLK